jgi:uncharacterized protein (TIGR00725 family)
MIAVCGPNEATESELAMAEEIGQRIARAGHALVCGGRGGVMAAASRGAKTAGGTTVGILPGYDWAKANPWIDHVICTGMGQARNAIVVASGEAVIAVGGGFGTLSEIALALKIGRPVIAVGGWQLDPQRVEQVDGDAVLLRATDAEEAVRLALEAIRTRASRHG